MKKSFLMLALLISQSSFAAISQSKLEDRHQGLIEEAITNNCGNFRELTQVSSTEEVIVIDQGIRDSRFVTVLSGLQRLDQNIFDQYTITVVSEYADMYDHETKNWGAYSVSSVKCVQE